MSNRTVDILQLLVSLVILAATVLLARSLPW